MMALSDLLFGTPAMIMCQKTTTEVILGPIIAESEKYSVSVASHALEDGSEVSDHVHAQPENFSVSTFLVDANDFMKSATSLIFGKQQSVMEKIALLRLWQDTGELVTYSGPVFSGLINKGYDIYVEDLIIENLSTERSADSGEGIKLTLSLRKIRIAQSHIANVNLPQAIRRSTTRGTSPTGTTSANPRPASILSKMFTSS